MQDIYRSTDSSQASLTQAGLDNLDGAVVVLDGLVVLVHVAQRRGNMVVGLRQQTAVRGQVLELQGQTLLEVFKRLGIVTCGEGTQINVKQGERR